MIGRGLVALITLGVMGVFLIWRGLTGDVMKTPLGDSIIPPWMYLVGGVSLLLFPFAYWFFVLN